MFQYGLTPDPTQAQARTHELRETAASDPIEGRQVMPGLLPGMITLPGTARTLSEEWMRVFQRMPRSATTMMVAMAVTEL